MTKTDNVSNESIAVAETTTPSTKVLAKNSMTLKQQVNFVRKNFQSEKGYLITVEIKRITQAQAMIHGVVYDMEYGKEDLLAYEGNLIYPIKDQNFQGSQFVLALNLGQESLVQKFQSMFKDNASNAIGTIVQIFTSMGIKIGN